MNPDTGAKAPAAPSPPASGEVLFLDLEEWKAKARVDRESVRGLGVRLAAVATGSAPGDPGDDYVRDFTISTSAQDRDRDVIEVAGWDWTNYFLGGDGVVLWAHSRRDLPVGKCPWIKPVGAALVGRCVFPRPEEVGVAPDEPYFANTVRLLYAHGFLKNTSVGFLPDEWTFDEEAGGFRFLKQEGLEWSLVPVPANPQCFSLAKAAGIDVSPVAAWARECLDGIAGEPGLFVARSRLERVLRALGCERGVKVFDLAPAEVTREALVGAGKSGWQAPAEPDALERLLAPHGVGVADLVAAAKAARPAEAAAAPADDDGAVLELEAGDDDDVVELVGADGRELDAAELDGLIRSGLAAGLNRHTGTTGKVF